MDFKLNFKFLNIILLGFTFMLVFTAFQTCSMIQTIVLKSYKEEHDEFNGDGFISLAIVYIVFAAANWIAPVVVDFLSAKWSMFAGGVIYTLYVALFLHPYTWSLYLGSVLIGIAAAVIWTAQGNFLTVNSSSSTIARNSGIFWAMLQCSLLFGNLFYYFQIGDSETISDSTRMTIFYVLTSVSAVGVLLMIAFQPAPKYVMDADGNYEKSAALGPLQSLENAVKLLMTPRMMLLSFTFFYTGLELGFFSGVYGTCVGQTLMLENSKGLIGLNGVFIGVGEIVGGASFGLLGKKTIRYGRDPIIVLGYLVHMISFFLIFLNLPFEAAQENSSKPGFITPNMYVALLCSFLLGLADSCYNTQCYSIVGALYPDDSSAAFAIFKFFQSFAAAVSFFYSLGLYLEWQLLILVIFGTVGTLTFIKVELDVYVDSKQKLKAELATATIDKE